MLYRREYKDEVRDFKDFTVFQYWNPNKKAFEPRALNNLSIRFNDSLTYAKKEFKKLTFNSEEEQLTWVIKEFVDSAKYAYYGNASYEASGPNSCCGGDDSIQEQFTCWALNIPVETYRKNSILAYSEEIYKSPVVREWVINSEYYKYLLRD